MCHFFAAMVAETKLFWGGVFNMIRWIICVIGIAVDNLGCRRIGTKKGK